MTALKNVPISFRESGIFDDLFLDYSEGNPQLKLFYAYNPDIAGIQKMIGESDFNGLDRETLVSALNEQYREIQPGAKTKENIHSLLSPGTYTITTGHQLCLFTGPLYFIYKIISTINCCEELNKATEGKNFVPVYWMATEDHDLEEINHVNVFGKKVTWVTEEKGRAGELGTAGVSGAIQELKAILGDTEAVAELIRIFEAAYLGNNDLASATRFLVNELFGKYGLVIIDANTHSLKQLFRKEIAAELFSGASFGPVNETINRLKEAGYKAQVNPREINLFYAKKGLRERIERTGDKYKVLNTGIEFTKEELEQELENNINAFSPNVVLRPLYQQKILPNVAYIGGPGELAYWLEYKSMFVSQKINYPVLIPRNFVFYLDLPAAEKMKKLGVQPSDLFVETDALLKRFILASGTETELTEEKQKLSVLFEEARAKVELIDKTIGSTVEAEKQKALNGISVIEQKLIKALKTKNEASLGQLKKLKEKLFPGNVPQERVDNFAIYFARDPRFIEIVKQHTPVFDHPQHITVLVENP